MNKPSDNTRHSLLLRLGESRNELAWEIFYDYYQGFIGSILRRRRLPPADIADLRQEVCLLCWKALQSGSYDRSKGRFRNWLATVCVNAVNAHLRRFHRQLRDRDALTQEDACRSYEEAPPSWIEEEWQVHLMRLAWDEAKLHYTEGVLRVYKRLVSGDPAQQVASEEGLAVNTVHVYRNRVEDSLAAYIRQLDAYL
jgi:RNA polymerase sigma factor (sigma-70 family)